MDKKMNKRHQKHSKTSANQHCKSRARATKLQGQVLSTPHLTTGTCPCPAASCRALVPGPKPALQETGCILDRSSHSEQSWWLLVPSYMLLLRTCLILFVCLQSHQDLPRNRGGLQGVSTLCQQLLHYILHQLMSWGEAH